MKTSALAGVCVLLVICSTPETSAQSLSVSTLAGSTTGGGYNDDVGSAARFSLPEKVAIDSSGVLYVADTGNHVIRKIMPDGHVSTLAGKAGEPGSVDGVGAAARFKYPFGIAIAANGTVFVADTYNHTIRSISPTGLVTTIAGVAGSAGTTDGNGSAARFTYPFGVAVDASGAVYVADTNNHAIRKIVAGTVTTLAGSKRSSGSDDGFGTQARFYYPFDVAVDASGFLYVADTDNHEIRKISPEGRVTTVAGVPESPAGDNGSPGARDGTGVDARFNYPHSIDVDAAGNMYVADTWNYTIRKISPATVVTTVAGTAKGPGGIDGVATVARFAAPTGVAVGPAGDLVISDRNNHAIRRLDGTQRVSTVAGSMPRSGTNDGVGTSARFEYPEGVAFDQSGNVYVADSSHVIRKITPDGGTTTFAGYPSSSGSNDGSQGSARFQSPHGVAVDPSGNIFVADTLNHTIRKITPAGIVTTFAGVAGEHGAIDGLGAQARFYYPWAVATDRLGNVYVADTYNHQIRMIEPTGVTTTFAGSGSTGSSDGIGTAARFYFPSGIALDDARNIYVADWGNHTIRKITQSGNVSTLAGSAGISGIADGAGSTARFYYPNAVAARPDGTLFVADTDNHTIRKITPTGTVTTIAGTAGTAGNVDGVGTSARFFVPDGVAVDASGHVVIADTYNHAIRLATIAPPRIQAFTATAVSSSPGQVLLSWSVADATQVVIDNGVGSVFLSGVRTVTPTTLTKYTIFATGDGGTVSASVTAGNELCINGSRYCVTLTATDSTGKTADGFAIYQSNLFGYFSLPGLTGSSGNPEVFVKVVGPVKGVPWVFYAGLTNLEYTIRVYDTVTGNVFNSYHVATPVALGLSQYQSVGNFDVAGATSVSCSSVSVTESQVPPSPGSCIFGLCLLNRFRVTLNATDNPSRSTNSGPGTAITVNSTFGFFSTPTLSANSSDIQAFVKMVDATAFDGHYWVFLGGLTDFRLTFTVTDTQTGRQKIYDKPAGSTCGWNDTKAFP